MTIAQRTINYVPAFNFYITLELTTGTGGTAIAAFSKCSGLGMETEYDTVYNGGENDRQYISVKRTKYSPVTLERGVANDIFWAQVVQGCCSPTINATLLAPPPAIRGGTATIMVFNRAGIAAQTWTLTGAVAVSWKAPSLQADNNQVAVEELTLAYEKLTVA